APQLEEVLADSVVELRAPAPPLLGLEAEPELEDIGPPVAAHAAVPPTVSPSISTVGWPTPAGTLCPALPHTPTPSSSLRSSPIPFTRVSTVGPSPISVAPLTGSAILPPRIRYASVDAQNKLPLVMATVPPPALLVE